MVSSLCLFAGTRQWILWGHYYSLLFLDKDTGFSQPVLYLQCHIPFPSFVSWVSLVSSTYYVWGLACSILTPCMHVCVVGCMYMDTQVQGQRKTSCILLRQGLSLNLELMFCGKASSQQALVIIMSAPNGAILQDMKPLIADYTVLRPKCGSAELGSKANAYL